jgi:hypothetical protein
VLLVLLVVVYVDAFVLVAELVHEQDLVVGLLLIELEVVLPLLPSLDLAVVLFLPALAFEVNVVVLVAELIVGDVLKEAYSFKTLVCGNNIYLLKIIIMKNDLCCECC